METRRTLRQQRDEARAARDRAVEQRDEALSAASGGQFTIKRLAHQLAEVRDELDAAQRKLIADTPAAPPSWRAERRDLRRALMLADRARRSLTDQIASLQAANEAMCREQADGAPTWEAAR